MEVLDPIIRDIIIGVILTGGVGLVVYIKRKFNRIDKLCQRMDNLEKTIQVLTKLIAIQTKRSHPEDIKEIEDLEELIDIMMKNNH